MADETVPIADFGETREFDRPERRREAFFELLNTSPQVFRAAVDAAITHALNAEADPQAERWTPLGPRNVGGSMRAFAQDPRRPTTLYVGSGNAGPWKSEDDGYTWRQLGGAPMLVPVGALALAPSDPRVLYVGTGETAFNTIQGRGLYRSDDGGDTFEQIAPPGGGANGAANHYTRIVVDPNDARRCWVASDTGLWRFEGSSAVQESIPLGGGITDVVLARDPADSRKYVLLAGIHGQGIRRGVYDRDAESTAWSAVAGAGLPAAGTIRRVRLAFSRPTAAHPTPVAYAVFQDAGFQAGAASQGFPTRVLRSPDFGRNWPNRAAAQPPEVAGTNAGQAFYSMVIEVDPLNADRVVLGYVDMHISTDAGLTWPIALDWRMYDNGDRAQHADFHALHFDVRNPRQLWVCNDGGVSMSPDINVTAVPAVGPLLVPPVTAQPRWRKKSFGITAAQFVDITTHPTFPVIVGGGMQDNGTFVSYGGPTWYRLFGADGGALGIDPNDPRRFFPTWQSANEFIQITPMPAPPPPPAPPVAPPENTALLPDVPPPNNIMVPGRTFIRFPSDAAFNELNAQTFIGVIASDPQTSNLLLMGRSGGCYYTTNGTDVGLLNVPAFTGDTSALAFSGPGGANRHMWIGTTTGRLFLQTAALPAVPPTPAAGAANPALGPAWTNVSPPGAGGAISGIAVHPLNLNVVAVSTFGGDVFLTHDEGANWQPIRGTTRPLAPGAVSSVAWHPTDTTVLFAGTIAGVYVTRDLPARPGGSAALGAALDPEWRTYSLGLPLSLVNDLEVSTVTNTMRCATFGRGVFEVNVRGATPAAFNIPEVKLSIRDHPVDDARAYAAANAITNDPRLPAGAAFDLTRAIDVRVDAPGFIRSEAFTFGETIDGSEFDETLVCDNPLVGDVNHVYVQVQNRGSNVANNVQVFLYFADAGAVPGAAPAITGDINYPNEPAAASPWKLAAPVQEVGFVHPGEPVVVRFEWIPPFSIASSVALLAVCSNGQDNLAAIPAGAALDFVRSERRAALRVLPVNRETVFIRDGVDDDGVRGGVAWGGRSPDIIVLQAAPAGSVDDADAGPFRDLGDPRTTDRARPGANLVYVRVHNRTAVAADANVRLFQVPNAAATPASGWASIGPTTPVSAIPPRGWKFAGPIAFPVPPDPDPGAPDGEKAVTLMALANTTVAGAEVDPFPDTAGLATFDAFWRFFLTQPLANNAAMRSIRFTTAAP